MSFIVRNEGFVCEYCGEKNPPAVRTCRNHCRKCLCSKHVDADSPGDRGSECGGKMETVAILPGGKKSDYVLLQKCVICGCEKKNRMVSDDNFEEVLRIAHMSTFG